MRAAVLLMAALGLLASGCSRQTFPADPYFDACTSDDQCGPSFQCLEVTDMAPGDRVCTTRCTTASECPRVVSDHCGDQTRCSEGVCDFFLCI